MIKLNSTRDLGLVGIWWYTNEGEFWSFTCFPEEAHTDGSYLQYSATKNHLNLWKDAVKNS